LDDVLDPADKEELSQKIESSEFAEDLVHRTRDTMRRLRLSAPQVIGTGMALDPNTVSEYLDNVLPPEEVGDFERICLESDVHLAEAAACHHVLTMVLGEPADVEPRARQRMYAVPNEARERKRVRLEAAHTGSKPRAAAMTVPISHEPTATVEIPDYLRAGSWWQSRGALVALAAVVLIGTTLYLASGLTGWFGEPAQTSALSLAEATEGQIAADTPKETTAEAPPLPPPTSPPQPATPGLAPPAVVDDPSPYDVAQSDQPTTSEESALPQDMPTATSDDRVVTDNPADSPGLAPAAGEPDRYAVPPPNPPALIESPPVEPPLLPPPSAEESADDETSSSEAGATSPDSAPPAAEIEADANATELVSPSGPREMGTYLGGKTVLLRYDDQSGAWFRIAPRDAVAAGERLVALPEFQPKITLSSGMLLDVLGGTQIVVASADEMQGDGLGAAAPEAPAVEVVYGRILLINTSMADTDVRLKLGPTIADARLGRNATLAVEVERQYVPGNDPRETPSPVVVHVYVPDGGVTWKDAAGEKTAEGSAHWSIGSGATTELAQMAETPDWIDQEPTSQTSEQRFGAPVVESTLVTNQPVDTQLLELFQGSSARREVKSLVTKASIHVGLFEPFVDALRDSEQRANWKSHIEALRLALAISPDSAAKVWRALVAQRGEQAAADLYEMLCGYNTEQIGRTPEQRKTGALARLIDWLENDSLDYRVLAVHDLAEITGKRLMSNPAAGSVERTQNVRRWRARLEADELRPLTE
jgi:hypothetical protein